jgi:hypothetical protein
VYQKENEGDLIMKVIKNEVFQENQNNLGSHDCEDAERVHQGNANDAYLQNEVLSSIGEDSQEIKGAFARQWLNTFFCRISALVNGFPIYVEIPDGIFPNSTLPHNLSGFQDSQGKKGRSAEEVLLEYVPEDDPNFEDGTWMTVHIQIPQTILDLKSPRTSYRQSNGDSIHERTEIPIGTNNLRCNGDKCDGNPRYDNT